MVVHNLAPQYDHSPELAEITVSYNKKQKASERFKIKSSQDIFRFANQLIPDSRIEFVEHFVIVLLNRNHGIIGFSTVSIGGMNSTIVDPKVVFAIALKCCAMGIALCHNHPSGITSPSEQDIRLTKRLKECADLFDMTLLDHIIIGEEKYYSFADEGII